MKQGLFVVVAAAVAVAIVSIGWLRAAGQPDAAEGIHAALVPTEGTQTTYNMPLSLHSLPQFIGWWSTLVPQARSDARYVDALNALVAPCCDDNPALKCCCETQPGQACNLIRSAQGLAAHLVIDLGYDAEQVKSSVLQWLQFARADYYVAAALASQGLNPARYGLTMKGSCYRGMCDVPISQGGCGGMNELLEAAIAGSSV